MGYLHLELPSFDDALTELDKFIGDLIQAYNAGKIQAWDQLEERVKAFFTPEKMDQVSSVVPHWRKMASYADGLTLVHVMCVFMGLYMLPEFTGMLGDQQQLMKWVILFHDVEKEIPDGKRDHTHAFKSAVGAAQTLPELGFQTTSEYELLIDGWGEFTRSAGKVLENSSDYTQDNSKLPIILDGIERMFGHNTPGALIIKTILFHLSVDMNYWPPTSPLTDEEVKSYIDMELVLPLLVMHLADGDGWLMFHPEKRALGRNDTIKAFKKVEQLISE